MTATSRPQLILTGPAVLLVAIVCVAALSACSSRKPVHRWNDRVLEAGRLADEGEASRAEASYRKLLDSAPGQEERRYVLNELAALAEERGDVDRALQYYERVWSKERRDEYGAKALYRTGVIYSDELEQPDRGLETRRRVITRYPASASAEYAVEDLADHYAADGRLDEMTREFEQLYDRVAGKPIGDNLLFRIGRQHEKRGFDDEALRAYRRIVREYGKDSYVDDALWRMSKIYRAHQMWRPAVQTLELCAAKVEESWFIGSYDSPWANDARFQLGMIHLLYLDDYETAIGHFERYLKDFPHSIYADDAAWHIVEAHRLRGNRGTYFDAMRDFIEDFPESRHVRAARARLGIADEEDT